MACDGTCEKHLVETAMIPKHIIGARIEEAIRLIIRDGMPPGRRSRRYCLATKSEHLPPKYAIALAHQVATGELLSSDRFRSKSDAVPAPDQARAPAAPTRPSASRAAAAIPNDEFVSSSTRRPAA